jgi:hypothetical protein
MPKPEALEPTTTDPNEKGVCQMDTLATLSPRARLQAIDKALRRAKIEAMKAEALTSRSHLEAWR